MGFSDPKARQGHNIRDGSGLSAQNYVKPAQLEALLKHGFYADWQEAWLKTLPAFGLDGTTRRRGNDATAGRVWAKTGYIYRARTLSGYLETEWGEPLIFVLMANNYQCSTREIEHAQDRICAILRRLKPSYTAKTAGSRYRHILSKTLDE